MHISHGEYLKFALESKKLQLEELNVKYRIDVAIYSLTKDALTKDIRSIEKQLEPRGEQ